VGSFPLGASPYEILDMGGNVYEWTRSLSNIYPDIFRKGLEDLRTTGYRILKGGSWSVSQGEARCASFIRREVTYLRNDAGFRIVLTHLS
jgi:formylglycine-generating enzyme